MESRRRGSTQLVSAAKSGISERSGRDIERNRRKDPQGKQRHWRTRTDPFSKQVHLYHNKLHCYLDGNCVARLKRVYGQGSLRRARSVDYRHVTFITHTITPSSDCSSLARADSTC